MTHSIKTWKNTKKCNKLRKKSIIKKMRDSRSELPMKLSCPSTRSEFESATSLDVKASSIISSCRICLSSILDPAALTCGHRFCEKCLTQYWRIREKPDFIVCPLCRACAFNVDFAKKDKRESTEDFRKTFTEMTNINESDLNNAIGFFLKMSILMPALYCLVKWLKIPFIVDLFTSIRNRLIN